MTRRVEVAVPCICKNCQECRDRYTRTCHTCGALFLIDPKLPMGRCSDNCVPMETIEQLEGRLAELHSRVSVFISQEPHLTLVPDICQQNSEEFAQSLDFF
jgi:hypothetical protein